MNDELFECLLQGVIRRFTVAFHNRNQKSWSSEYPDCSEWWPSGMRDASINRFSITIDKSDADQRAIIESCGRKFTVEISGKRIGMYGCTPSMTDAEMVEWFNATMDEIGWGA